MSLQIKYSKELAKEYGQVAVYLPGSPIEVGDIVTFDYGKSFLGKARPLGSFQKKNSLKNLGVPYQKSKPDTETDTYFFKSSGTKIIETGLNANGNINEALPKAEANIGLKLSSEGSLFILAVECTIRQIDNVTDLQNMVIRNDKDMIWKDTFLVTSLTIAKKALIAQSKTSTSAFVISGDIDGIKNSSANVTADAKLSIKVNNGDAFIKPWSNNVTLFMEVMKFEEATFGPKDTNFRNFNNKRKATKKVIKFRKMTIEEVLED